MSFILLACYLALVVSDDYDVVSVAASPEPETKVEATPPKDVKPPETKPPERKFFKFNAPPPTPKLEDEKIKVAEVYSMELVEDKNGCKIYKVTEVNQTATLNYYVVSCTKDDITEVDIPTHYNISFLYNK